MYIVYVTGEVRLKMSEGSPNYHMGNINKETWDYGIRKGLFHKSQLEKC